MDRSPSSVLRWLFASPRDLKQSRQIPRWLFLRALGAIYFSAFFSLVFQIHGLIGRDGILPSGPYLDAVARTFGHWRGVWYAPSLLWFSSGSGMLTGLCWVGMIASVLVIVNLWPRGTLAICFVCFLSFVSVAQDFSSYQSDGMLLEAGFISLFFAPPGFRPGWGITHPASRASHFLLLWEWLRIYFESGMAKILSGDPEWRNFTAMDEYYQNGPLPTWIGWYVQHLPHWFHAATVYATLGMELGVVWMFLLPRRWRIVCFFIVTPWEIGVILTANYTFLNYLVLVLGVLLLDDRFLRRLIPASLGKDEGTLVSTDVLTQKAQWVPELHPIVHGVGLAASAVMLSWIFYATTALMLASYRLPSLPVVALEPFRIANRYGLFAVMTRGRYEIEFQGSDDGQNWKPYRFRYKPQLLNQAPRIYAPYQPRFDWNLWFASLGSWRDYPIVPNTIVRLFSNDQEVLQLFAANPFPQSPPKQIRTVLWQYWFTSIAEKHNTGLWWKRQMLGRYAPTLEKTPNGDITVVEWDDVQPRE